MDSTTNDCQQCEAGTFNGVAGQQTECSKCQAGTYSKAGATSCSDCETGKYSGEGSPKCYGESNMMSCN